MRTVTIGEIARVRMGETLIAKNLTGDGLPVYSAGMENRPWGYTANSKLSFLKGTIVISARGSIGFPKIPDHERFTSTQTTIAVQSLDNGLIDSEYLCYHLALVDFKEFTRSAAIPMITVKQISGIELPLPNIGEQRRIVVRIKECMERIEEIEGLRAKVIADSEKLQSAVFADYVESLSDIEIGTTVLGDVVAECKYGTSKKANTTGKGCPILRMGNIRFGKLDTSDLKHIDLPKLERQKCLLQDGDILINRTNSLELVGKSAVFLRFSGDWVYASYLIRLRIDPNKALPLYVNAVINSRIGRNYVFKTARRAIGMVNINAKEIHRMPMPLPSIEEQAILIDKMNEAEPLIDELVSVFQEDWLTHIRDSILRKAFAGEL